MRRSFAEEFRNIVRDYEKLKVREVHEIDCWYDMELFHQRIAKLLEELRQWSAAMEHDLEGRWHLQQLVRKTDWSTDALQLFWNDQLGFYASWIDNWLEQTEPVNQRCVVNISMRKMLMLLRLARDAEVLPDDPLKHAFVFITKYFRTAQQEHISYESIRKKYSQMDSVAIAEVEGLLRECLSKLAEYKKNLQITERG